jgi:hypothetical protein
LHWSRDAWKSTRDDASQDITLGVHLADIATDAMPDGTAIDFTFQWLPARSREGEDFRVLVIVPGPTP